MRDHVVLGVTQPEPVLVDDALQFHRPDDPRLAVADLLDREERLVQRVIRLDRRQLLILEELADEVADMLVEGAAAAAVVDKEEAAPLQLPPRAGHLAL